MFASLLASPMAVAVAAAGVVTVAAGVLIWALRSPAAMDNPAGGALVFLAIIILAAMLWPLFPVLLIVAIPASLVALTIYIVARGRRAT